MATEIEILLSLSVAAKRANNLGRDTILAQALALLALMGDDAAAYAFSKAERAWSGPHVGGIESAATKRLMWNGIGMDCAKWRTVTTLWA
jgi:hypothetical protein